MFQRFTEPARTATIGAQAEARALRHGAIGCEHLLIALAAAPQGDAAGDALRRSGLDADRLREAVREVTATGGPDADALAAIGIDLDEVRRRVETSFGPGALERGRQGGSHLPFSREAKKSLELALRYAVSRGDGEIGSEHVLLGVLRASPNDGPVARALVRLGVEPDALRALLERERSA